MSRFDSPLLNEGVRRYSNTLYKGYVHHLKYDYNRHLIVLNPHIRENIHLSSVVNIIWGKL
jgi:hypothetical protein